ncbi:fibronectin type III domain-containing protein [Brevibacillus fluminis]|uniref:fibronectin type III domain-containing protein n=1 Tax=Brevibacillus fluminis TaxID=511487 RepID=UPI003F8B8200
MAYTNGEYVGVGADEATLYSTTNLKGSWNKDGLSAAGSGYFYTVNVANGQFVAVGDISATRAAVNADTTAPVVGSSGTVTASHATSSSVDLNWTAATDAVTSTGNLQYKVVYSTSNNLDTVANAEANGTVAQNWTANVTSATASGLTPSTTYYFNVLVKDEAGNKSLYSGVSQATTAAPDTTAPVVGNSGTVTASQATPTSVDLSWTAATDTVTDAGNLQYKVVYSTSNNLDTVANAETNGTVAQNWTANVTSATASGLTPNTTYYFNVLVKDEAGNKSLYSGVSQETTAAPDTTAPVVGNGGTVTASQATPTSVDLNWTAATDAVTSPGNLQYKVVYSTSNNLDTVANAEANGTVAQDWTANVTSATASGLTPSTTYYFNVLVKDEAGNKSLYSGVSQATTAAPDTTAPVVGNSGTVTASQATPTSVDLNWTAATDAVTSPGNLQYKVVYSTSNNLDTVANAEANGTVAQNWTANVTSATASGLTPSTTYYFNVLVKDEAGNKALYSGVSQATTAAPDMTAPVVGNGGTVTASQATPTSVDLNWTAATDAVTSPGNLQYKVVYSTSNNLDTVANAEANGTVAQNWTANVTSATASGLTPSTTYYFNVLVKDEAGNKSLYSGVSQATTAAPDTTAPVVGNNGTVTASQATPTSVDLNWTAATDAVTSTGNLQYKVVYSTSNNLDTVANAEANGTVAQNWTANVTSATASGLTPSTTYYFNVLVKDEAGNKSLYSGVSQATTAAPDTTAPVVGNGGTVTASQATPTSVDLSWTAATDTVTDAGNLQYKVVYSTTNNLDTVANAEANGTVAQNWTANVTSATASGLTPSTTYYFNVLVKDEAGNKALYSGVSQATTAAPPTQLDIAAVEHLAPFTGVPHGTAKTAAALGLPDKVAITLSDGRSIQTAVDWDLSSADYEPAKEEPQTFTVYGALNHLPTGVSNSRSLRASIKVSVNGKASIEIVAISQPAPIVDVENGTPKTARALGLPERVEVTLRDNSTREVSVKWDVDGSDYDPDAKKAQAFSITGNLELPAGIDNPKNLTAKIHVTVKAAVEGTRNIVAVTDPSPITDLPNGAPKTAGALGLPETVEVTLNDDSTMQVRVKWDVEGASYDPANKEAQSFIVNGILTLPEEITNTRGKSAKIYVTVNAEDGQEKRDIVDVINPEAITGLKNGTAKTANALELPKKVRAILDDESFILVPVSWDVDGADYDPDVNKRQKFTVDGSLTNLPADITNSHNKTVQVSVTVDKAHREDDGRDNDSGGGGGSETEHSGDSPAANQGGNEHHAATRQAILEAGSDNSLQEQIEITREISASGEKVDSVLLDNNKAEEILREASQHGKDIVRIVVDDLPNDPADKVEVKLSKTALDRLKKQDVSLEFKTAKATVTIPKEMVANLSEDALYFEIVPMKNSGEVADVAERVGNAAEVRQAANGQAFQIIGNPVAIETNYRNIPTKVVFPLDENTLPKQPQELDSFLASLAVFVEHTDGDKELKRGQLKYDEKGKLVGIEIVIDKFSTFAILSINGMASADPDRILTRAEVAYELAKLVNQKEHQAALSFTDVQETHWAIDAIQQVSSAGLMVGDGHGQFHPDLKVTRAEMATIMAKWKQSSVSDNEAITFSDTRGHWAANIIEQVRKQGIMKGYADGSFHPDQGITQKEMTILIQRLIGSKN